MDVSLWWVVVAAFAGVWTGFVLFAVMTIAREPGAGRMTERSLDGSIFDARGPSSLAGTPR